MSRNLYRQVRKDSRRAIRRDVRNRKASFLLSLAALACFAASPAMIRPAAAADQDVPADTSGIDQPGMESPFYSLTVWDSGRTAETVAASYIDAGRCFAAMGAIILAGGDAACLPMGRVAALGND